MSASTVAQPTSTALEERLILASVDCYTLAFPALWVSEIVRFQQAQILDLPFYRPPLLGLMHQNGQVVTLVSAAQLLHLEQPMGREVSTVVRLGEGAGKLAQVGIVVDKVQGGTTRSEVPETVCQPMATLPQSLQPGEMVLLRQEWFSQDVWQPQQWMT